MVAQYTIAGRQFGSHVLAMATLGTTGLGAFLALRGGSKSPTTTKPSAIAASKEEEEFIRDFIRNVKAEEEKSKH